MVDNAVTVRCEGCGFVILMPSPGPREAYYHCPSCHHVGWVVSKVAVKPRGQWKETRSSNG